MIPLVGLVALLSVLKQRTDPATRTLAGVLVDVKTADLNSKISYCIQEKGVEKHKLRFWRYSAFAHVPVGDGETVTTQVSVKQWIEGLTSNKANALDFTRLLKVSEHQTQGAMFLWHAKFSDTHPFACDVEFSPQGSLL